MKSLVPLRLLTLVSVVAAVSIASPHVCRADRWENRSTGIDPRVSHTAVFTGTEVILWGGGRQSQWLNDGARYELATDTWRPVSQINAPSGRWFHGAAWTGTEMIIWGGRACFCSFYHSEDGGIYNPQTDTWRPMNTNGAPRPRGEFATIWTGSEMIIWGGETTGYTGLADGARYNPQTDIWRPLPPVPLEGRFNPNAVWTGTEMLIWGGLKINDNLWSSFGDGARYNPATDTWAPINAQGAPSPRTWSTAVWTGTKMIIWGGRELLNGPHFNDGAIYDPVTDSWTPITTENAPAPRILHTAVWSGAEMIVWGGAAEAFHFNTGGRYNPATGVWRATTQVGAPRQRHFWRPDSGVWTGEAMFICGGIDYPIELNSTDLYYPDPVISPADEIRGLIKVVNDSPLARSHKRPLLATLRAALASFERGNSEAGVNQLRAFQQKVRAQFGRKHPELAADLIAAAQKIIDAVGQ